MPSRCQAFSLTAVRLAIWGSVLCYALSCLPAAAQTLDHIIAAKTVRVGFVADQPPFSSRSEGGRPAGYAIDICGRVVEEITARSGEIITEYVEVPFADAFEAIADSRVDLLCGAITINLPRRAIVDFSQPVFYTGASALLRTDSPRDLRELFLGERLISAPRSPELRPFTTNVIGVRTSTTTEAALRSAISEGAYRATVVSFRTHEDALQALESRQIDAYVADRVLLVDLLGKARDPSQFFVASKLFTREAYGIALRRGDADLRLLVDNALSKFYRTEAFGNLLSKYFGSEAPGMQAEILNQSIPE